MPIPNEPSVGLRTDAAGLLRQLGHALVGRDVDDDLLAEIVRTAARWTDTAMSAPERRRTVTDYLGGLDQEPPMAGEPIEHFADCLISGPANPLGMAIEAVRTAEGALIHARLGRAHEGIPGRAHGGVVAAIFDDSMGFVTSLETEPIVQGELTIRYLEPTPIDEDLEVRVWPVAREGRKFIVDAVMSADGRATARARGVHIVIDRTPTAVERSY